MFVAWPFGSNQQETSKMDQKPDDPATFEYQGQYADHDLQDQADEEDGQEEEQDQENMEMEIKPKTAGRGRIEYKLIENPTNRQVTYSKRKNGLLKKSKELAVLCDAKISVVMISPSGSTVQEYHSPGTSAKEMLDLYQKNKGTDVWESQHEKMQQTLRKEEEKNYNLKRQIWQRKGRDLSGLNFHELNDLEHCMSSAVEAIRMRKDQKITNQTNTTKKKLKSLEDENLRLVHDFHAKCACEDSPYGPVDDDVEDEYESMAALANGASNLYAFRRQHHHHHHHHNRNPHPRLHLPRALHGGSSGEFDNSYDMRNHLRLG